MHERNFDMEVWVFWEKVQVRGNDEEVGKFSCGRRNVVTQTVLLVSVSVKARPQCIYKGRWSSSVHCCLQTVWLGMSHLSPILSLFSVLITPVKQFVRSWHQFIVSHGCVSAVLQSSTVTVYGRHRRSFQATVLLNKLNNLILEGPCIIFCNIYTFQRYTQCCSTDCLLMHRCELYMFRTVTVHPRELLFRCCMCRLWYVVRNALSDTSRWSRWNVYIKLNNVNSIVTKSMLANRHWNLAPLSVLSTGNCFTIRISVTGQRTTFHPIIWLVSSLFCVFSVTVLVSCLYMVSCLFCREEL